MMALYSICLVVSVAQGREDIDVPSKNLKAGCILLRKSWNNRSICGHYVAATLPPEEGSAYHGDSIGTCRVLSFLALQTPLSEGGWWS